MKHERQYNEWSWIVTAIDAIERCGKARRLVYSVLITAIILAALFKTPEIIVALAAVPK
jgi:hypothetical protein